MNNNLTKNSFFDEKYFKIIEKQVLQIANQTVDYIDEIDAGLCSGNSGLLLFYSHLNYYYPNQFNGVIKKISNKLINTLTTGYEVNTHANGISGIGFTLQFVKNNFNLEIINENNFLEIDDYLKSVLKDEFSKGNWDPLHGYVGIGIYFLERSKVSNQTEILHKIIDQLDKDRIEIQGYNLWITKGYKDYTDDNINFGMAHGIPGVISFLTTLQKMAINPEKCNLLINDAIRFFENYIEKNEMNLISLYPSMIELNEPIKKSFSRVGWCYGDLCLANMFYKIGYFKNDKLLINRGNEIVDFTLKRAIETYKVDDAGFCHGTGGVIFQFYNYYKRSTKRELKIKIDEMINLNNNNLSAFNGIGGFLFLEKNSKDIKKYASIPDLLEGSIGVAMVYLDMMYNIKTNWEKIFLIDLD